MVNGELFGGRPPFPPIYVPYKRAATPYDGQGFLEFPQRSGWEIVEEAPKKGDAWREAVILRRLCDNNGEFTLEDRSIDEKAGFIQTWLFFGALTEALETASLSIQVDDLLERIDGVTVVSTVRLHEYDQVWALKEAELGLEGREMRVRRLFDVIRGAEFFLSRWAPEGLYHRNGEIEDVDGYREPSTEIWEEQRRSIHQIYFSAVIVCRFIRILAGKIFPDETKKARFLVGYFGDYLLSWSYDRDDDLRVSNFLVPTGQCPSEAQMLRELLVGAPRFFLYYLQRLSLQKDHCRCTQYVCKAQEIPSGTYKALHTSSGCRCPTISVDGAELACSLQKGKIPRVKIIQAERDGSGSEAEEDYLFLTITDEGPYVAISHVWSHGLGNHFNNGLPTCQLLRLKDYVSELGKTLSLSSIPNLWIDTLCIPVDPSLKDFRRLAIELIPRTFYEAVHVLVLDEELYCVSLKSSMMEIGLRILCSAWMRRLWTLAEGVYVIQSRATRTLTDCIQRVKFNATRLSIQLLDGSLSYSTLAQMSAQSGLDIQDHYCCHDLWAAIEDRLPNFVRSEGRPMSERLFDLSVALKFRTTSRVMDEPVCVALMLGIPTLSITRLETLAERMRELYILIGDFPINFLFFSFNPPNVVSVEKRARRSLTTIFQEEGDWSAEGEIDGNDSRRNLDEIPGFSWAPRSFLSAFPGVGKEIYGSRALCNIHGMHFEYHGFVFDVDNGQGLGEEASSENLSLSTILSSPRLTLRDKNDNQNRFIQLERRSDNCNSETELCKILFSSSLRRPYHGGVLFDDISVEVPNAIVGCVGSDEGNNSSELKFYPLAKGHSLGKFAVIYSAQFQPSVVVLGISPKTWSKWCVV